MSDISKLKPLTEQVLISELVMQAKFAKLAAKQLEQATEFTETWAAIQSILVAVGNVSKILWPARKIYKARGEHLRKLLQIDEDNLLTDRTFRNHFEHYDERIENWLNDNSTAVYTDPVIDPFEPQPWSLPKVYHRKYNPVSKVLTFRDENIDLSEVLTAIADILKKCRFFALT
jgi:hypothetical protein